MQTRKFSFLSYNFTGDCDLSWGYHFRTLTGSRMLLGSPGSWVHWALHQAVAGVPVVRLPELPAPRSRRTSSSSKLAKPFLDVAPQVVSGLIFSLQWDFPPCPWAPPPPGAVPKQRRNRRHEAFFVSGFADSSVCFRCCWSPGWSVMTTMGWETSLARWRTPPTHH